MVVGVPPRRDPLEGVVGVFVCLSTAVLYGRTLHPSVAGGDSGELMAVAHELATPHPPGYPSFALYTKIAEVAFRLVVPSWTFGYAQNAGHAVLSTAAVLCLYLATARVSGSAGAGAVAAFLFGFSPNVWTYAIATEVFPLNNLFMSLLVLLAVDYWRALSVVRPSPTTDVSAPEETNKGHPSSRSNSPRSRTNTSKAATARSNPVESAATTLSPAVRLRCRVRWSAFVCGLALTNQHTSILFVVPIVCWVLSTDLRGFVRDSPTLLACVFAGMSPYVYLPLSSTFVVSTNSWGLLNRWSAFWAHFFRAEYGTFSLASQESTLRERDFERAWRFFLSDIVDQQGAVGVCLTLVGVAALLLASAVPILRRWSQRKQKPTTGGGRGGPRTAATATQAQTKASTNLHLGPSRNQMHVGIVLMGVWLLYNNFFNYLANLPIHEPLFYGVQQRFWIQPLIITCLLAGIGYSVVASSATAILPSSLIPGATVAAALWLVPAAVLCGLHVREHYASQDESGNFYVRDYGVALLRPLPNNSILLTKGDLQINAARYAQTMEGFRPDVRILDQELLTYTWYNVHVARKFPEVVLPGVSYFPGRPGRYDMKAFLDRNRGVPPSLEAMVDISGNFLWSPKRRVFIAAGWKENDPSHLRHYTTVPFGTAQEVLTVEEQQARTSSIHTRAEVVRELHGSIGGRLTKHRPPAGRYKTISWEHVVYTDYRLYLTSIGFQLMTHGEALTTADGEVVSSVIDAGPETCLAFAESLAPSNRTRRSTATLLCSLLRARQLFEGVLEDFEGVPNYVRRNLSVALQKLIAFASRPEDQKELREAMLKAMQRYTEVEGKSLTKEEQRTFAQVIRNLQRDLGLPIGA